MIPEIWITGAQPRAGVLAEKLRTLRIKAVCRPLFDIQPLAPGRHLALLHRCLNNLAQADWAVLVSAPSATAVATELNALNLRPPRRLRIAAVGPQTARAARAAKLPVHLQPKHNFSSEGLLEAWQNTDLTGKRIIIFRAQTGRGWLARQLKARGAQVSHVACYQRQMQTLEPGDTAPQLVLISSLGSLRALQTAARHKALAAQLRGAGALAYSPRLMHHCRAARLFAWSETTTQPTDRSVCAWLAAWRTGGLQRRP